MYDWGDVDGAFAEADHVVEIGELHFDRFNSTPLELDAALVEYNRGTGQWTIYCNNQFPGFAVIMMGPALGVGLDKLRMVTQDIGGGFGNKITSHPQLVACCLLARKLNRPVQWTEARTDFHQSMSHGNERWFQDVEVAVKANGEMLGFRCKALDDAGAFLRYEPLGGAIWVQVSAGHVPLAQHPRRVLAGRHQQGARVAQPRLLAHAAPVADRAHHRHRRARARTSIRSSCASSTTCSPSRCRTRRRAAASTTRATTRARSTPLLELIGYDAIEARRADAKARGKLLGFGIGSTLDSGTNNFAQSTYLNPELQFSGNSEVATVKLDIFGEVVVTLGHDAAGPGPRDDDRAGRRRHPRLLDRRGHGARRARLVLELARGLLGHLRQPVRGLGPLGRQGRGRRPGGADEARSPRSCSGATPDDIELAGGFARLRANHEVALPFMALGAIVNVNNASLPEDFDATMNVRYVYRPHFEPLDLERKFGNLTLTYAMQIHACVLEIDPETGVYEIVDYAVDRRLRQPHQPADRRGPGHGRHGARARRGDLGDVRLRRGRQPADAELLRLPRAARARHAAAQDGRDRVAVAVLAARHEGHGRGRRRRHPRGLRGAAGRAARASAAASSTTATTPTTGSSRSCSDPAATRADVKVESA